MRPSAAGFTLIEIMLVLLISSVILLGFTSAVLVATRTQRNAEAVSDLENDAHETVSRIADELRQAGTAGPGWSISSNAIYYNRCTGSSGGNATWDTTRAILTTNAPGENITDSVDNNGNNLVDEEMLVMSGDGIWEGWVTDLPAGGLTFSQNGNDITVTVTLSRPNADGVIMSSSASTVVSLRN